MPARATVFDKKCNPLLELGTGPYNTIRWNPKGKCILHFLFYFFWISQLKKKLISYFFRKVNSYILFWFKKKKCFDYIYLFTFVALILLFCSSMFGRFR
jgi:hypothetical protein